MWMSIFELDVKSWNGRLVRFHDLIHGENIAHDYIFILWMFDCELAVV